MNAILVLTDFSIKAEYAAEFALQIASKVKADILLCNVLEYAHDAKTSGLQDWPDQAIMEQESLCDLEALANYLNSKLAEQEKPKISYISRFGKLTEVANAIIQERGIDLVVMGSHRSSTFSRFIFGSHTHDVLDHLTCPVLLIPECLKYKGIRSLVYATDLTFSNIKVLKYLTDIARPFGAEVQINHISTYKNPAEVPDAVVQNALNELVAEEHPRFKYTTVGAADVRDELLEITKVRKADIFTLVHKRYNFLGRILHTSISKSLANEARVPLLVLPYTFSIDAADISNEQLDHYCFEPSNSR